jgi:hypothetical protein
MNAAPSYTHSQRAANRSIEMSIDYVTAIVRPTIPAKFLAPIESWLLRRLFETEARDDRLSFQACWTLNDIAEGELFPDDELIKALAGSRETCPDLCFSVEREIEKASMIILGTVNYKTIFQSILRRHADVLGHIMIEEHDGNTKSLYESDRFTLITADAIESIGTRGHSPVTLYHRSGPCNPASPYIFCLDQ